MHTIPACPLSPLSVTTINGEPRIHDLDLAARLGFKRPADIRYLIRRNKGKLRHFSKLEELRTTSPPQGGRPATEYWLTQKQALFLCVKAETANAFAAQHEIILVFDAYLNSRAGAPVAVPPGLPDFTDPVAAARAWADLHEQQQALTQQLQAQQPLLAFAAAVKASDQTHLIYDAAKLLGVAPRWLWEFLCRERWLKKSRAPMQHLIDAGVMDYKCFSAPNGRVTVTPLVTGKGLARIQRLLVAHRHLPA